MRHTVLLVAALASLASVRAWTGLDWDSGNGVGNGEETSGDGAAEGEGAQSDSDFVDPSQFVG